MTAQVIKLIGGPFCGMESDDFNALEGHLYLYSRRQNPTTPEKGIIGPCYMWAYVEESPGSDNYLHVGGSEVTN